MKRSPVAVDAALTLDARTCALAGASQVLPHAPQFCGSALTATQAAPHSSKPGSHSMPHFPAAQVAVPLSGAAHAIPHSPQLSGLALTSIHAPLQFSRPPEHPAEHSPLSHACAAEQVVRQSPQRFGLLDTSTHAPLQLRKPAEQSTRHTPCRKPQCRPDLGQAMPQSPQFFTSTEASTQLVPQAKWPGLQANAHCDSMHTGLPFGGALQGVAAPAVGVRRLEHHALAATDRLTFRGTRAARSSPRSHLRVVLLQVQPGRQASAASQSRPSRLRSKPL